MVSMQLPSRIDPLTERSRRIWSSGDYDRISVGFRHEAELFVERRQLQPNARVLDAACGSGNLTIPAARTGAIVSGIDIVPSLVHETATWARAERLSVHLDVGSVEALPYRDEQFDVVLSMFGVMFASRPLHVAAELARVTRPGGYVALANWTKRGFIGRMLMMHTALVAPPPDIPSPLAWADENTLRDYFDEKEWDLAMTPRMLTFRYPHTPAGTAELFRAAYGPTVRTFEALDEDKRARFSSELRTHWESSQRPNTITTEVDAEYLEVIAIKR